MFGVLVLALAACDVSELAFVQDHRVEIVAPDDRAEVSLPVTVRWEVSGFDVTGRDGRTIDDAGYFAVFVDRPPMPPAKTVEWLAERPDSCGSSACGSVEQLPDVYVTDQPSVTIDRLPADTRRGSTERHEAVVVLLDGSGTRIGESAFYVRFTYKRRSGQ